MLVPRFRTLQVECKNFSDGVLVFLTAALLGLSCWSVGINDPDLGWHLLGGAWIYEHQQVPTYDFINSFNSEWLDYHWLGQLFLHKLYLLGGFGLLRICFGIFMAYFCVVLADIVVLCLGQKPSVILVLLFTVVSIFLLSMIGTIRPQMIALFCLACAVRMLLKKPGKFEIAQLALLTIFLANVHVYWIFIPLLWFCFRVMPGLIDGTRHKEILPNGMVGVALLLCGAVSPYGFENYALLWNYFNTSSALKSTILEFRSAFGATTEVTAILIIYVIALLCVTTVKRLFDDIGAASAAIVGLLLAFVSIKFIGLFAIFGLPYIVRHGSSALLRYLPNITDIEKRLVPVPIVALMLIGIYFCIAKFPLAKNQKAETYLYDNYPLNSCSALAKISLPTTQQRDHVRVLTHFNYGGWCRWAMYQADPSKDYRVTSDGRTQFVPDEQIKKGFDVYNLNPGWKEILAEWKPDAAVVSRVHALNAEMNSSKEWKVIFSDKSYDVFVPSS